jgi:hypothetical protein
MRMSPIDQPLMLMELLGRRSQARTQDIPRRILGEDVTQIEYTTERVKRMVGRVLTGNGITRYCDGLYTLIGAQELSDSERDALLQLCRQRLDGFREQRGGEVYCFSTRRLRLRRSLRLRPSLPPPQPDQRLGEIPGAQQSTGPLRVLRRQAVAQQTQHQRALTLHQPD